MQVTLTSFPVINNAQDRVTRSPVDTSIKSRKIELILAALSSLNSPYIQKDIYSSDSFTRSLDLIKRMSPGGKLALARTLLEQL